MIFLDTGYFKGLYDKNDFHHETSLRIKDYLEKSNEATVINTTVLVETLNGSVGTRISVKELYYELHDENQVIELTKKDYLKSVEVNSWFGNSLNYNDCTIFNTMMEMGIHKIVSFDGCFRKINSLHVIYAI